MLRVLAIIVNIITIVLYLILLSKKNEKNVQIGCELLLLIAIINLIVIWGGK